MSQVAPAAPIEPAVPDPAAPTPVVSLIGVHRAFGDKPALAGFDLSVREAAITVLLGPNGAGKTTAIRVITGALGPDRGEVRVFGLDPADEGETVRRRCGVVSAKPALYDRLSGFDNLMYSAQLYGLGRGSTAVARIQAAAERFEIADALGQQVGGYSTGMKTRLALSRSVLHEPDLLLFDEPTSGLDPESSVAVLKLIRDMTAVGTTVVMCTHLLLEAEGLADHVVVLDRGRDLISGAPGDLARQFWPKAVVRIGADDPAAVAAALTGVPGVLSCDTDTDTGTGTGTGADASADGPGSVTVAVDDHDRVPELVFALAAAGVRILRVEPYEPSLEDLYFAVRGRTRP